MTFSSGATPAPVMQSERIDVIDALRGFAILGILLMNIPVMGLPGPSGFDPTIRHEFGTINYQIWYYILLIPEGTQRAIFSLLFGAGIILFTSRQEKRLDGLKPADYFLRRQMWLMIFGLIDIYLLLWFGDILFMYACYGILMFTFRNLSPKKLLTGAGICLLLMVARENIDFYREKQSIVAGERIKAMDTTKVKLTERQKEQLGAMTSFKEGSAPEKKQKRMETAIRKSTGSYAQLYEYKTSFYNTGAIYLITHLWDVLIFMFIGMAFYKMGIVTGQAPAKVYWIMAIAGLGIGLTLSYINIQVMIDNKFDRFLETKHKHFEWYSTSRAFRALGIFAIIMLLYKSGWMKWLFALMRPVGQMAFTNYLTQSLICAFIFYGIGFGLYGKLQRYEVYGVMAAIWVVQIIWSHIWLRFFYFGPLEWCWRSLSYWKRQPFIRKEQ